MVSLDPLPGIINNPQATSTFWWISSQRRRPFLFFVVTLMLLYFSAVGIYHFEHVVQPEVFSSVFHSLWWAVATLTTVGYGDAYPVTAGGRLFTFLMLLVGLGVVAVPPGLVASALSKAREMEDESTSFDSDHRS